jgi:hypothetical protein
VVTNHAVVLEEAKAVSAASSDGISMSSRVKGEAVLPSTMPTMEASELTERHDFITPFADSTHPLFSQVCTPYSS